MAATRSHERSRSGRSAKSADSAARSRAKGNGKPVDVAATADDAVEGASGTLQQVVGKAKGPALAGGAALAAIAGGVALARNGQRSNGFSRFSVGKKRRRGIHMPHVSMPHPSMPHLPHRPDHEMTDALRATAQALGATAVEVGKAGYRAGELASEVRRVREAARKSD